MSTTWPSTTCTGAHLGHMHVHGPGCGHPTVDHDGHVDYVHGVHRHVGHDPHYDEH